jgi:uncharacterized phage infection (PIP) family protein YhgE
MMIKKIWDKTGVVIVAGATVLVIAYLSGAGSEVLWWMAALLIVVELSLLPILLKTDGSEDSAPNSESDSEDLSYEMDLLVMQVDASAKDMLGHVHEELSQMRSLISDAIEVLQNSFNDLSHESKEQIGVVQEVLEKLQAAQKSNSNIDALYNTDDETSQFLDAKLSKLSESTKQIDQGINSAVRSLQFEDIVRQLTLSSEKHLDYLDAVLAALDEGVRDLNSQHISVPEYIVGLHELRAQIGQLEAECKVEAERSVSQKTMQQGEVELF